MLKSQTSKEQKKKAGEKQTRTSVCGWNLVHKVP